ncbi:MAG TPA: DUF4129 domain-containing protein [Egicoccus sp.]|nr:DUF4129 domain-containing protein [Egicoccus sp.]HSK23086.1 DUF4129 domain-containing protein [Egicoccus sp.]
MVSAVVVLALVVLGAAVGGSWELEDRDFGVPGEREPPEVSPPEPLPTLDFDLPEGQPLDWGWLEALLRVLVAVAVLLMLWWGWQLLRDRLADARADIRAGQGGIVAAPEPDLPVLRRGVAEAQRHLDEVAGAGDAVIAAWLALEDAAQESGVRRAPAQTPTEFTLAVLERTTADPDATRELLGLYHRARFSDQPVGDVEVARASDCLARLAASWATAHHEAGDRP